MFNASLHVKDTRTNSLIPNAEIIGNTLTDVKQPKPGVYELTLSAPGNIKVCAPGHSSNDTYIYELDEYIVELETD